MDPTATVQAAFAPQWLIGGDSPILGVFLHQGDHYTAMIQRDGTIYHIDSLPGPSGEGRYVYEVTSAEFAHLVGHYRAGQRVRGGSEVGGPYSVYYVGQDV